MFTAGPPVPNKVFDICTFDRLGRILLPLAIAGMVYLRDQQISNERAGFLGSC
jgi:hypothetical protein